MPLDLSERQKRIMATALTVVSLVVVLAAAGALLWLAARFLRAFSHVFLPLAVAAVAALVLQPYYEWLRRRLRLPTPLALLALLLSGLVPLVAFGWFFGALIVEQCAQIVEQFPAWWTGVHADLEARWPAVVEFARTNPVAQRVLGAFAGSGGAWVEGLQTVGLKAWSAGAGVVRWAGALFGWAVMPVYLVFFLGAGGMDVKKIDGYLPFLKPATRRDVVFLAQEFLTILVAFFRGQLLIALIQGALFAVGFVVVGLRFGLVLGLTLGLLNVVPYLGSMIGLAVALPLAYFQQGGGWGALGGVLVVFFVVQLIEGYLLTPRIMGDRTGLHPMTIIVAVFFWGSALDGVLGMILAIPLTAFLVVFWRLARERYIEEWV